MSTNDKYAQMEGRGAVTGTVKWWNLKKGYGFIVPHIPGPDIFVHVTAVLKAGLQDLKEGQQLEYELKPGRDGKVSAQSLRVVS